MKNLKTMLISIVAILLSSWNINAQNEEVEKINTENKIEVLDFHSTRRCMTCNAIEANTKFTLEKYFADELKSGKITFQSINIDEKENYAIAEKFQASGTSLFLNVIDNGKEAKVNLTDFAFKKGKDKAAFSSELKRKIKKQLAIIE